MAAVATARVFALASLTTGALLAALSTAPAATYCPNPALRTPQPLGWDLRPAVAKAFQVEPITLLGDGSAFVRCDGKKLLGCVVGANLNCGKADRRRTLPGATAFCREHPGAPTIPLAATGHETIYDWQCQGRRAVAGDPMVAVDRQGYVADNWKEIEIK